MVAPWCSGSTIHCCFCDPGSILALACWEVTMVRLPGNGPFWKYDYQLFKHLAKTIHSRYIDCLFSTDKRHDIIKVVDKIKQWPNKQYLFQN